MCFTSLFKYIIIYPYTQNVHLYKDINGLNIAFNFDCATISLTAIIVAIIVMVTISVMSQDMSGLNPEFLGCFMLFHVQSLMRVCICLYGVCCVDFDFKSLLVKTQINSAKTMLSLLVDLLQSK